MTRIKWLFACVLLLAASGIATGQNTKPSEASTVAQVLDSRVSGVESEFVSAAEAMPEEKYSFAPTDGEFKGVRTFAQQVKHVAAVNYMVGAAILQGKPPVDVGSESGPDGIKTKAEIVTFLQGSFAYMHKAVGTINDGNLLSLIQSPFSENKATRLGLATLIVGHCFDHYGQMVVYLRMNGIVPPASR
jgi:hypothetical protein